MGDSARSARAGQSASLASPVEGFQMLQWNTRLLFVIALVLVLVAYVGCFSFGVGDEIQFGW
jgi:hypothetical protein